MSVYEISGFDDLLSGNTYPGRGLAVGLTPDGKKAVIVYFIMGRSSNSRNRIFTENGETVTIYPFDESKVEDPSLIIYSPVKKLGDKYIVTNGDQTDTIYDHISDGKTFEEALDTRCFEPDKPNFTPRISALLDMENGFEYKINILKSADANGSGCNRFTFSYFPVAGLGHFIHTYNCDGDPIPSFTGEPERIKIENDIDTFSEKIWASLDQSNKVSMYMKYIDIATGTFSSRIFNKNK